MANYVHNYIFCCEMAKDKLLTIEYRLEISGYYDKNIISLSEGKFLVIFDTHGMEYKTDFIKKFINEFNDTLWYCVEENVVKQGFFRWDGEKVEFRIRELVQTLPTKSIKILYADIKRRPIIFTFISDREIVIENILQNVMRRYRFQENSRAQINQFIHGFLVASAKEILSFPAYVLPLKNDIAREIDIDWENKICYIETYGKDDDWQNGIPDGEQVFNGIISFFEEILQLEKIEEKFTIKESILELL